MTWIAFKAPLKPNLPTIQFCLFFMQYFHLPSNVAVCRQFTVCVYSHEAADKQ